jgi:hypothetical protein
MADNRRLTHRYPVSVGTSGDDPFGGQGEVGRGSRNAASMPERVSVEKAITRVSRGVQPALIAIDGLPCSGKGTLVGRLKERIDPDDAATIRSTGIPFPLPSIGGNFDSSSRSSSKVCQPSTRRSAISMASRFSLRAIGAPSSRPLSVAAVVERAWREHFLPGVDADPSRASCGFAGSRPRHNLTEWKLSARSTN